MEKRYSGMIATGVTSAVLVTAFVVGSYMMSRTTCEKLAQEGYNYIRDLSLEEQAKGFTPTVKYIDEEYSNCFVDEFRKLSVGEYEVIVTKKDPDPTGGITYLVRLADPATQPVQPSEPEAQQ